MLQIRLSTAICHFLMVHQGRWGYCRKVHDYSLDQNSRGAYGLPKPPSCPRSWRLGKRGYFPNLLLASPLQLLHVVGLEVAFPGHSARSLTS